MGDDTATCPLTYSQEELLLNDLVHLSPNMLSNIFQDYNGPDLNQVHNVLNGGFEETLITYESKKEIILQEEDQLLTNGYHQAPTPPASLSVPPPPTTSVISDEEYSGPLNFEVSINPHLVPPNKSWVYSHKLNKVYIGMGSHFPVDFRWAPVNEKLFIRAMPLYSLSQYAQNPVTRCIAHVQKSDASNQGYPEHVWNHVVRCHAKGAEYQGNENEHHSVVAPIGEPQTGDDCVRVMYQFVCKNSCPNGINRRPLEVVFTLENIEGKVLGRAKVNIRICSSPKRDREKDEKDYSSKRLSDGEPSDCKKKKQPKCENKKENVELKLYDVTIPVVGKHNVQQILKYAFDMMAGDQKRYNIQEPFQSAMNKISDKMGKQE